jgi:hypothetical protein
MQETLPQYLELFTSCKLDCPEYKRSTLNELGIHNNEVKVKKLVSLRGPVRIDSASQ